MLFVVVRAVISYAKIIRDEPEFRVTLFLPIAIGKLSEEVEVRAIGLHKWFDSAHQDPPMWFISNVVRNLMSLIGQR